MKIALIYYGYIDRKTAVNSASFTRLIVLATLLINCGVKCVIYAYTDTVERTENIRNIEVRATRPGRLSLNPLTRGQAIADRLINDLDINVVAYVSAFAQFIIPIRNVFKRANRQLKEIVIANDWYIRGSVRTINFIDSEIAWKILYPQIPNIIAISTAFVDYFARKRVNIVRIPSVFDISTFPTEKQFLADMKKIVFTYAGNLKFSGNKYHQKDLVANFHVATSKLSKDDKDRIILRIIGTKKEDYIESFNKLFPEENINTTCAVEFVNYLTGNNLFSLIQKSHFTILFRPDLSYAKFGFSTKFAESMALSVPVFGNITSDMGLYLHDGIEGIVAKDESVSSILQGLKRICTMDLDRYLEMRNNAKDQALKSFDMNSYEQVLCEFVNGIK